MHLKGPLCAFQSGNCKTTALLTAQSTMLHENICYFLWNSGKYIYIFLKRFHYKYNHKLCITRQQAMQCSSKITMLFYFFPTIRNSSNPENCLNPSVRSGWLKLKRKSAESTRDRGTRRQKGVWGCKEHLPRLHGQLSVWFVKRFKGLRGAVVFDHDGNKVWHPLIVYHSCGCIHLSSSHNSDLHPDAWK